jgi:hypothetical protein
VLERPRRRSRRSFGHASAAFTLTVYGHIFDTGLDDLADRLEILRGDGDGIAVEPIARAPHTHAV